MNGFLIILNSNVRFAIRGICCTTKKGGCDHQLAIYFMPAANKFVFFFPRLIKFKPLVPSV